MFSFITLISYMVAILPTGFAVWFVAFLAVMLVILGLKVYQFIKDLIPFFG